MIQFTHKKLPNSHIQIEGNKIYLRVSLNVEPTVKKHLSPNNIFKGDKMWVYSIREKLTIVSENEIISIYTTLINRAMVNIRQAKKRAISNEIKQLTLFNNPRNYLQIH